METITVDWLDEVLERKLSQILTALSETRPVPVADFIRLIQFERRMFPPKLVTPEIIWIDRIEPPEEEQPETQWDDSETKWRE